MSDTVKKLFKARVQLQIAEAHALTGKKFTNVRLLAAYKKLDHHSILYEEKNNWIISNSQTNNGDWLCVWFNGVSDIHDRIIPTLVARLNQNVNKKRVAIKFADLNPDIWRIGNYILSEVTSHSTKKISSARQNATHLYINYAD